MSWAVTAEDARLLRAEPVPVNIPPWFSGGNPAGIAELASWRARPSTAAGVWMVQNLESERGRPPSHFGVSRLGSRKTLQLANFERLAALAPFDRYLDHDYWEQAVRLHQSLVEEFPQRLEAMLISAKTFLIGTHTAAELPSVSFQVMRDLIRPTFPNSDLHLITVDEAFSRRLATPRALLRDLRNPKTDGEEIVFQSSHGIIQDTYIGLTPFIETLLTSLSPYVWGVSAGRAGAIIVVTFGKAVGGRERIAGSLLELSATSASATKRPSWRPQATVRDFERSISWWMARLDLLFSHLTEPENCTHHGEYDPRIAHERILTAIQLFRSAHMVATVGDSHTRRLLLYNILDQLTGLNPRAKWPQTTTASSVQAKLRAIEERMPEDVQRVLLPRAHAAAASLKGLQDGFFARELLQDGGIRLPDKSGGRVLTSLDRAASEWLRVMRNSAHGFEQQISDRQRTLIAAHNASIPEDLPDVAWLHLLHLLTYPEQVALGRKSLRPQSR